MEKVELPEELSAAQAAEYLGLGPAEKESLPQALTLLRAQGPALAADVWQRLRVMPLAPTLWTRYEQAGLQRRLMRRLRTALSPWDAGSERRAVRRARLYRRLDIGATVLDALVSLINNACADALSRCQAAGQCEPIVSQAVCKRLSLERTVMLAAYHGLLRQQVHQHQEALTAKAAARSAALRSTVRFSQAIADEIDEGQVINALADHVMRTIHPDGLVVNTIEADDVVEPRVMIVGGKLVRPGEKACSIIRDDWQRCRAARTGHCFHVSDVTSSLVKCPHQELPQNTGSYCCIPLTGGVRVHGWMHLTRSVPGGFSDDELEVLGVYGQMTGTAITSLRLVRENRHQATTDALTGLYNRRHFQSMLARENVLLKRRGGSASIVMVDVDDFKHFNDLYGHDTGDHVLSTLAAAIRDSVRTSDEVARLGGDEFVLLLRDCGVGGAAEVARKIVAAARAAVVSAQGEQVQLCVSVGTASCPEHAKTLEETMLRADMALLQVKEFGGDRYVAFEPALETPGQMRKAMAKRQAG